ncbi:hypothetical protein J6590_071816 [Homalodisca vitripennis]|nr:hypothetical protein J6590_071816 [Homalodisca vitripennis]
MACLQKDVLCGSRTKSAAWRVLCEWSMQNYSFNVQSSNGHYSHGLESMTAALLGFKVYREYQWRPLCGRRNDIGQTGLSTTDPTPVTGDIGITPGGRGSVDT